MSKMEKIMRKLVAMLRRLQGMGVKLTPSELDQLKEADLFLYSLGD